ncbi:MAG TPA: serine hydrolase domain-containing protein [Gammaproteobacteria bacterium]|nr:serine hydrolase domain-containing protein [Gammaproteobacteria bacterium]
MMRVPLCAFVLLLSIVMDSQAAVVSDETLSVEKRLHQELSAEAVAGFSGQVLVARDGVVLLDSAIGWSDAAHTVPITKQTKFYVASITKSFTAVAILCLRDQGRLNLTDPACETPREPSLSSNCLLIRAE